VKAEGARTGQALSEVRAEPCGAYFTVSVRQSLSSSDPSLPTNWNRTSKVNPDGAWRRCAAPEPWPAGDLV